MRELAKRVGNMLASPRSEWEVISDEPAAFRDAFRYVAMLAALPPIATIAGRFTINHNISNAALASSFWYLLLTNLFWYGMYVVDVVITGIVLAAILTTRESRWNGLQGLRIAAYSFTPFFIAGAVAVLPWTGWIVYAALPYSIYLLYLGIISLTGLKRNQAIGYTAASFLSAAVIVGVLNLFEYLFESFITGKIFS